MMAILKQSIEAFRSNGIPGTWGGPAHAAAFDDERDAFERRDGQETGSDERRNPQRCEEMFYWGMAGGPWY